MITLIKKLLIEFFDMIFIVVAALLALIVFFIVGDGLYGVVPVSPWIGAIAAILTAIVLIFVYSLLIKVLKNR